MTIFLILVVIAGVLFIANVNTKASPDRSNNLFFGTTDGDAGFADSSASFSDVGFCSDGGGGGDCGGGGCSN
jgi:uncharacterized membrane protein YgcG